MTKSGNSVKGKFYGVGVGPGDPELITLKARRVLRQVDVVCCPRPVRGREGLALKIARREMRPDAEVLELRLPMVSDLRELERCWCEAADAIYVRLSEGKDVAFVTLGDPAFYSTYGYVLRELKRRQPELAAETVPGITSLSACAAALNLTLVEGEEKLAVVPAGQASDVLFNIIASFDNIVVVKPSRSWDEVRETLRRLGGTHKAVLATRCGLPGERFEREPELLSSEAVDYVSLLMIKRRGIGD